MFNLKGGDTMKKVTFMFALAILTIGFISTVSAWNSSNTFTGFEKNSSTLLDSGDHKMNTSFVTNFVANSIAGSKSPEIRTSIQNKALIGWSKSATADTTITEANKTYQHFWKSEKQYRVKATWKQLNGYANIPSGSVKLWD